MDERQSNEYMRRRRRVEYWQDDKQCATRVEDGEWRDARRRVASREDVRLRPRERYFRSPNELYMSNAAPRALVPGGLTITTKWPQLSDGGSADQVTDRL